MSTLLHDILRRGIQLLQAGMNCNDCCRKLGFQVHLIMTNLKGATSLKLFAVQHRNRTANSILVITIACNKLNRRRMWLITLCVWKLVFFIKRVAKLRNVIHELLERNKIKHNFNWERILLSGLKKGRLDTWVPKASPKHKLILRRSLTFLICRHTYPAHKFYRAMKLKL